MVSSFINRSTQLFLFSLIFLQGSLSAEGAVHLAQNTTLEQQIPPLTKDSQETTQTVSEQLPSAETTPATNVSALDTLLNNVLKQTNRIDSLLQEIALVTSNNQSLTKEQRSAIAKEIREIRSQLSLIKNQSFTQPDVQSIYLLLVINKELCDHLKQALNRGFTSLDPFPLTKHISRTAQQQLLTTEQLENAINDNETSIALLTDAADNVGLSWYNKLYRGIDGYIIQPWQKHELTHYSMLAIGTAVLTAGTWWMLTRRGDVMVDPITKKPLSVKNPLTNEEVPLLSGTKFEQWLREKMGPHPLSGEITINLNTQIPISDFDIKTKNEPTSTVKIVINEESLKIPGYIENNIGKILTAVSASYAYIWPRIKDDCSWVSNRFHKKVVEVHNNLKGGSFKDRSIKTSHEDYFKIATGSFDDIVGAENAKEILSGVVDYLINPEKFDLAKITPEKGYLLTGPTRTGKTFMVEAFAGEVRKRLLEQGKDPDTVKYLPADVATITALGGIKEYLSFAKKHAPCIIFIDEIDLLGLQRAGGNSTMLADFLVALSDFSQQDTDKQVIILAATNRSENLDEALKRRGRLGIEIRFTYPSFDYRKNFFAHKLEAIGIATDSIDLDSLARQTVGRSYNDLDSVLKKALQQAKAQTIPLDQELLERAVDSELFLILPENDHPLSHKEQLLVASAVAGQALVEHLLDTGAPVVRATINPYLPKLQEKSPWDAFFKEESSKQDLIKYGKVFTASTYEFLNESYTTEQLNNSCKALLAGQCAQKVLLKVSSRDKDAALNMQKSFALAKQLVGKGIDEKMLSEAKRDMLSDKAYDLLDTFEQEVITLLSEHKEQLQRLVTILLKLGTLNRDEIAYIIDGKLPGSLDAATTKDTTSVIEQPAAA